MGGFGKYHIAFSLGMRPTHIDAHMAAAMVPELLGTHVQLAREYGLFPVLPRSISWPPDITSYRAAIDALDAEGVPVVDHCRGTLAVSPDELADNWAGVLRNLPGGLTHLALHCTTPGEFSAMSSLHAPWRYAEYELLASGFFAGLCVTERIVNVGTRALQEIFVACQADRLRGSL